MSESLIELDQIELSLYLKRQRVDILRNLSLSIAGGSTTAVVGPSGSGKSTLLYCIAGLISPSSGILRLGGEDTTAWNDRAWADFRIRNIGMVYQSFHLIQSLDARGNVALPVRLSGRSRQDSLARADELLEEVGLGARAKHRPAQLSGGEQQRVAIARAVANRPSILLADEPTGNLDDESSTAIIDLLLRETVDALVVVTHDRSVAARVDRQVTLDGGTVIGTQPSSSSEGAIPHSP